MADLSRRSFIKWVLSAAAASACPFPGFGQGAGLTGGGYRSQFESESNTICHQVRDQAAIPLEPPTKEHDIVIVGGGPSGLAAADYLRDQDFILLEKEGHLGGNAYAEEWEGKKYSTGAAFTIVYDELKPLFKEWGFDLKTIKGLDSACFDGTWIRDFWTGTEDNPAIEQLPYSDSVKQSFRQFGKDLQAMDLEKNAKKLDTLLFSDFLKKYTPELKAFWDNFGPSNWGATSDTTSAALGLEACKVWPTQQRDSFEGGLGIGSQKIYEHMGLKARKRVYLNSTTYRVQKKGKRIWVSFMKDGEPATVSARAVVMATPKFITKFLVSDIPEKQYEAMSQIRFAPYLTINLCFDKVVYNQGYDNWVVGAKNFTDFIMADWVTYADGGDLGRKQVLTMYAPRPESERQDLLDDGKTMEKAHAAVDELLKLFPSWTDSLREVRVYRRGHPMFIPGPGLYTKIQKEAAKDMKPIFYAHSDSYGNISDFGYAALNGIKAAKKALKVL